MRAEPGPEPGTDRLLALICARCGALLSQVDPLDTLLGKLAQLARFGLDSEGRPLLTLARSDN